VGVTRIEAEMLAFVQAGDIPTFTLRPVWQIPTTLYLSVADLDVLSKAIGQASAKVQALRGRP
jgi:hypothetical protein